MEGFELVDIFTTPSRLGRTTVICIFLVFHFDKCKEYFLISKFTGQKKSGFRRFSYFFLK